MSMKSYRPYPDALLNPRIDIVFKALFTQNTDDSRGALKSFISAVTKRTVTKVKLLPNEPAAEDADDKNVRFDVACTFDDGRAAEIEMQGVNEDDAYGNRASYLAARLLNHNVPRGSHWDEIKQVYQISVLNFTFTKTDSEAVRCYQFRDSSAQVLSDIVSVIFLELPKIRLLGDIDPQKLPSEQKWCKFFIEADNPQKREYIQQLEKSEEGIMQAKNSLSNISDDYILWKRALDREVLERDRASALSAQKKRIRQGMQQGLQQGIEQGLKQGMQQGIEQGVRQGKLDTARNLRKQGVSADIIANATGLSAEEIEKL